MNLFKGIQEDKNNDETEELKCEDITKYSREAKNVNIPEENINIMYSAKKPGSLIQYIGPLLLQALWPSSQGGPPCKPAFKAR